MYLLKKAYKSQIGTAKVSQQTEDYTTDRSQKKPGFLANKSVCSLVKKPN